MDWKKVHVYLYTFCRYFLATVIISYAFAKIFETQFISQPSVYDKPISSLTGFQLTWYYYGYSYWYGLVIAITQIISSLLLFFRKTARIGIVVFLTFMINILLTDFAYNIDGAKGMAIILTIMALFVLFSDYKMLLKYFIDEPPLFNQENFPNWMLKLRKVKFIYISLVFVGFIILISSLKDKYMSKNQFYGAWKNVQNEEVLYFEALNTFQVNKKNEINSYANGEYTFTNDSIILQYSKGNNSKDLGNGKIYFRGKYILNDNNLIIKTNNNNFKFKKIR